jgi:hypothetical protein
LRCSIARNVPGQNMTAMIPIATAIETPARTRSRRASASRSAASASASSARLRLAVEIAGSGRTS